MKKYECMHQRKSFWTRPARRKPAPTQTIIKKPEKKTGRHGMKSWVRLRINFSLGIWICSYFISKGQGKVIKEMYYCINVGIFWKRSSCLSILTNLQLLIPNFGLESRYFIWRFGESRHIYQIQLSGHCGIQILGQYWDQG
jgi:hypothetical protein